jgi:hypothetical protein
MSCYVLELPEAVCHRSERLRLRVEQSAARPKRGSATLHLRVNREVNRLDTHEYKKCFE